MKYGPWLISIISISFAIKFYSESAKIVTVEVPKMILKEVPKEVVKEVEKQLSPEQEYAISQYEAISNAPAFTRRSDALRGIRKVSVSVGLSEKMKGKWSESDIRDKITLEMRRSAVEVVGPKEKFNTTVNLSVDGLEMTDGVTIYSLRLTVHSPASSLFWDYKYHSWDAEIWSIGTFGYFGTEKASESQRTAVESVTIPLASAFLEANPIKRED